MKNLITLSLILSVSNVYACNDNIDDVFKYIEHISIEKKKTKDQHCRKVNILFKADHTYEKYIDAGLIQIIQNNITLGELPINFEEVITGTNQMRFCLNEGLIKESKIIFLLKTKESIKITPQGHINTSGSLCYTDVTVSIKNIVMKAKAINP